MAAIDLDTAVSKRDPVHGVRGHRGRRPHHRHHRLCHGAEDKPGAREQAWEVVPTFGSAWGLAVGGAFDTRHVTPGAARDGLSSRSWASPTSPPRSSPTQPSRSRTRSASRCRRSTTSPSGRGSMSWAASERTLFTSPDGITFTARTPPTPTDDILLVAYGNDGHVRGNDDDRDAHLSGRPHLDLAQGRAPERPPALPEWSVHRRQRRVADQLRLPTAWSQTLKSNPGSDVGVIDIAFGNGTYVLTANDSVTAMGGNYVTTDLSNLGTFHMGTTANYAGQAGLHSNRGLHDPRRRQAFQLIGWPDVDRLHHDPWSSPRSAFLARSSCSPDPRGRSRPAPMARWPRSPPRKLACRASSRWPRRRRPTTWPWGTPWRTPRMGARPGRSRAPRPRRTSPGSPPRMAPPAPPPSSPWVRTGGSWPPPMAPPGPTSAWPPATPRPVQRRLWPRCLRRGCEDCRDLHLDDRPDPGPRTPCAAPARSRSATTCSWGSATNADSIYTSTDGITWSTPATHPLRRRQRFPLSRVLRGGLFFTSRGR